MRWQTEDPGNPPLAQVTVAPPVLHNTKEGNPQVPGFDCAQHPLPAAHIQKARPATTVTVFFAYCPDPEVQ